MYSDKAYHIAENCRFCWMCRHVCPVGLRTGKEINTPRAKGLLVAMEKRGFPMDGDAAEAVYECMLCGGCSNDCVTGFEPPVFIREARTQAAADGLLPKEVDRVLDRLLETGRLYEDYRETEALTAEIGKHAKEAPVLLLLGETARFRVPQMALSLMRLLERAGIPFRVLEKEPATGSELYDLVGAVEETRQQAFSCSKILRGAGAETVVVLDSHLAETIRHQYPVWGCELPCEVQTATSYVAWLTEEGKLRPKDAGKTVTIHDSERLARDLSETKPVRALAEAAGCEIKEMFLNRELTKSCGNALFAQYAPRLAMQTGEGRMEDAVRTGADVLLTECPQALDLLSEAAEAEKESGLQVTDIFTLLAESMP